MSEKRFTTDNGSNEDVCLVDNLTKKEYESNFNDIVDLRYSHYYDDEHANECHDSRSLGPRLRSQLVFTLVSGKCFKLNDNAKGYEAKRKLWITHPEIDPDEDIKLYQAYRCNLSQYNK